MTTDKLSAALNGVYRTPANVSVLRAAAHSGGCAWVELDLNRVVDKSALLDVIATAFHFPDGFGRNWDALSDCMQDLSWCRKQGWFVVMRDSAVFAAAVPAAHATLLKILEMVAADWRRRGRVFVVLTGSPSNLPTLPGQ
jgi:hypothetical protein